MMVIVLALLVVKTDRALPGDNMYQSVLVAVPGGRNRCVHMPDDHLDQQVVIGNIAETGVKPGFHRHRLDRSAGRCQQSQHETGASRMLRRQSRRALAKARNRSPAVK